MRIKSGTLVFLLIIWGCGSGGGGGSSNHILNTPSLPPINNNGDSSKPLGVSGNFKLIWHDEFDVDGNPNPNNWSYEIGLVRNHEDQFYTPTQARVQNGELIITADRTAVSSLYDNAQYISASLTTVDEHGAESPSHSFLYGVIEARIKIPVNYGAWPAFWGLGTSFKTLGAPMCGEIDIMEYFKGNLKSTVWDSEGKENASSVHLGDLSPDWSSNYHIWTMDWDSDKIDLLLDGQIVEHYDIANADNGSYNPFREPFYIIINLALGGTAGGDPSNIDFPIELRVDWIRVFARE